MVDCYVCMVMADCGGGGGDSPLKIFRNENENLDRPTLWKIEMVFVGGGGGGATKIALHTFGRVIHICARTSSVNVCVCLLM